MERERTRIDVTLQGGEYVAEWGGHEVRAGNPFGLDSKLADIGAPVPRDLYLVDSPEGQTQQGDER
jgi:hypothetical protein